MLRHWSQFVPNMSTDIRGHETLHHHRLPTRRGTTSVTKTSAHKTRYKDVCPQDGVQHPLQRCLPTTRVQHPLQRRLPTTRGITPATKTSAQNTGNNTRYKDVCPQDGEQHPLQRRLPTRRGTTPATKTSAQNTGNNTRYKDVSPQDGV